MTEQTTDQAQTTTEQAQTSDVDALRDVVARAYPDVLPDLITGSTLAEMTASVETARTTQAAVIAHHTAHAAAAAAAAPAAAQESTTATAPGAPAPVTVEVVQLPPHAAGGTGVVTNTDAMSPAQLISAGLEAQQRAG